MRWSVFLKLISRRTRGGPQARTSYRWLEMVRSRRRLVAERKRAERLPYCRKRDTLPLLALLSCQRTRSILAGSPKSNGSSPAGVPGLKGGTNRCPHSQCGFPNLSDRWQRRPALTPRQQCRGSLLPGATRPSSDLPVAAGILMGALLHRWTRDGDIRQVSPTKYWQHPP